MDPYGVHSAADLDLTNGYDGIYEAQLRALTEQQRALLESAAVVGYKFDADILAGVWKRDVMGVIRELSVLEDGFVRDLNDEDNIYAFENRSIFKTVLISAEIRAEMRIVRSSLNTKRGWSKCCWKKKAKRI